MQLKASEWKSARWLIDQALKEDNARSDITTRLFVAPQRRARTAILAREDGVLSGAPIAKAVFLKMDPRLRVALKARDGERIRKDQAVMTISGPLAPILSSERTALNFLGHLSGVATLTRRFVERVRPRRVQILDTRKTTPGWRLLEKYAVRSGGGLNHRYCLKEVAFIKDNHWRFRNPAAWRRAVGAIRRMGKKLIIEVENEAQLREAVLLGPYVILFDNAAPSKLRRLCRLAKRLAPRRTPLLEASGGITLRNVRAVASSGVDRLSCGALTHAACHLDFSLEIL